MANILIVDDAKFMRATLATILKKDHHIVGEAVSGREAVIMYEKYKPELVLMDITMPELSGIDALKEIKKSDPSAKVIMCSALGQQKVVMESIEAGAKDFIVKPFEASRVLDAINRILR